MADSCSLSTEETGLQNVHVSQRRRQLFPTNDEDSNDLGLISPLSDSTPSDSPLNSSFDIDYSTTEYNVPNFSKTTISDYVILENICDVTKNDSNKFVETLTNNPAKNATPLANRHSHLHSESSMPSLYLSPEQAASHSPVVSSPKKNRCKTFNINDGSLNKLPCVTLKTPQATSTANSDVPKLIRKSPLDAALFSSLKPWKRKLQHSESPPTNKQPKLDQGARVRTVLFPKFDVTVPTTSFYSKSSKPISPSYPFRNVGVGTSNVKSKTSLVYVCGRKTHKKCPGEINAGVRHKIRKPKPRKAVSKAHILKAALNIIECSPLNDYLDSVFPNEVGLTEAGVSSEPVLENVEKRNIYGNIIREKTLNKKKSQSRKRELSPPPDPNKKFFKFKRSNATVTVDSYMKLKVDDGKFVLLENRKPNKRFKGAELKLNFEVSDLTVPDNESLISSDRIDDILLSLDDTVNNKENCTSPVQIANAECPEQLVLKAHTSVAMSENAIHLHAFAENQPNSSNLSLNCSLLSKTLNEKSVLLSPTSQMCNMTSGLALNSPKKAKQHMNNFIPNSNNLNNINAINEVFSASDMEQENLFPIFYPANNKPQLKSTTVVKTVQNSGKKFKGLSKNQLLLDAGQKKFGVTQCTECKFVYHMGDPNDELLHLNYHNAGNVLRFNGWKGEHVMATFPKNARIIRVLPSDPKTWNRKVKELLEVVNRDLGYYEMPVTLDNEQVYLYIKNKVIAGCLVAESKRIAHRLLSDDVGIDLCSERSYPVKCGVNRIWVSQAYRMEGIGTALLNCLRANFMYGSVLAKDDVAFSSPTDAGKAFARNYFSTSNFLIYIS